MKIPRTQPPAAFTMVEIAISLAIIGFALVAIIGVLPRGLRVQRENREETIINQDAAVFLSAIRNGARGLDDLTNYVYEIRRYTQEYTGDPIPVGPTVTNIYNLTTPITLPLTSGERIIGLLSWPKYAPGPNEHFLSNYTVAYVRSLSGPAVEKPPQTNAEVRLDAFAYRMACESLPAPTYDRATPYGRRMTNNLHELRLSFRWPVSASANAGGRQTFRTQIGGRLLKTNDTYVATEPLYFFEPQIFVQPLP